MIGTHGGWPDEGIPIDMSGNGRLVLEALGDAGSLGPYRTVSPDVNVLYLSESALLNEFGTCAQTIVGRALVTHLGANSLFLGQKSHLASFPDGMTERLLYVYVDAKLHGTHGCRGMVMIRGTDGDCVDPAAVLFQHIPVVAILGSLGMLAKSNVKASRINVAGGHNVPMGSRMVEIALALASNSNAGNLQAFVGPENMSRKKGEGKCRGGAGT